MRRRVWWLVVLVFLVMVGLMVFLWFRDEPRPDLSDFPPWPAEAEWGNEAYALLRRAEATLSRHSELEDLFYWYLGDRDPLPNGEDAPVLAKSVLEANREAFRLLRELRSHEAIVGPYSPPSWDACRELMHLHVVDSGRHRDEGDVSLAVESALHLNRLGEQLRTGAVTLLQWLIGGSAGALSERTLWECVLHPGVGDGDLRRIQEATSGTYSGQDLRRALQLNLLAEERLHREAGSTWKPNRTLRRGRDIVRALTGSEPISPPAGGWEAYYEGFYDRDPWAWILGNSKSESLVWSHGFLGARVALLWKSTRARSSTLHVGAALRRCQIEHGALPEELAELIPRYLAEIPVDPYTGKELRYRRDLGILYSVGENGKDDAGAGDDEVRRLEFPPIESR